MQVTTAALEAYKREYPEEAQAYMEEGAEQERDRWRGILAVAKDLDPRHAPLVKAMKADMRCTGADLAMAVMALNHGSQATHSVDRLAVQRETDKAWAENANIRKAFGDHNKSAFSVYRARMAGRSQPSKTDTQ